MAEAGKLIDAIKLQAYQLPFDDPSIPQYFSLLGSCEQFCNDLINVPGTICDHKFQRVTSYTVRQGKDFLLALKVSASKLIEANETIKTRKIK